MDDAVSVILRIGNDLQQEHPARATMRELRFGDGFAEPYSFMTACPVDGGGQKLISGWPDSHLVTVDPIEQFFTHDGDIRMTGFADMFVPLTENVWYSRQDMDVLVFEVEDYRAQGTATDANDEVGLRFKITRLDAASAVDLGTVWFDNASFLTSDILWEFNTNHGDGRWWPLYQIPGRKYVRVTVPKRTDSLRIRAYSSNTGEWVQKAIVFPRDDAQHFNSMLVVNKSSLIASEQPNDLYLTWDAATGGRGRVTYKVFLGPTNSPYTMRQVGETASCHFTVIPEETDRYCAVCANQSTMQDDYWFDVVSLYAEAT